MIGNIDTIASGIANLLGPWLRPQTTIDVRFDAPTTRQIFLAIEANDHVLDTKSAFGGATVSYSVPANANYSIVWQGPGFRPASALNILAPRERLRWRLFPSGKSEDNSELLALTEEAGSTPIAISPAQAQILVATAASQTQNGAPGGSDSVPEIERALSVIGLFERGTTECSTEVSATQFGIDVGCLNLGLPGALGEIISRLDPRLLKATLGDQANIISDLASQPSDISVSLMPLAALTADANRKSLLNQRLGVLVRSPEFRLQHRRLVTEWYQQAVLDAQSLGLNSERGALFLLDRKVQPGSSFISKFKTAYGDMPDIACEADEPSRLKALGELAAAKLSPALPSQFRDAVLRRIQAIVSGHAVFRGIDFDLQAMGIRDDIAIMGFVPLP